jgi:hypothetical protein
MTLPNFLRVTLKYVARLPAWIGIAAVALACTCCGASTDNAPTAPSKPAAPTTQPSTEMHLTWWSGSDWRTETEIVVAPGHSVDFLLVSDHDGDLTQHPETKWQPSANAPFTVDPEWKLLTIPETYNYPVYALVVHAVRPGVGTLRAVNFDLSTEVTIRVVP